MEGGGWGGGGGSYRGKELCHLFNTYRNVFSKDGNDLGYTDQVEHRIHTTSEVSIEQADRRIPLQLVPEVKKLLGDWLKSGIIAERSSLYASQMAMVKKKSVEIRVCIDYRQLNRVTYN